MADTYTTNLNLTKPEPGAAEDTWGISLNADLDSLDAIFGSGGTAVSMGAVTLDGLIVDGVGSLDNNGLNLELSSSNTGIIYDAQNGYHTFKRNGTNALQINGGNGDIAFYDDSGTSQNLKWDASADTLNFVDNAKAKFGTGSDLQIYHHASDGASYIKESGSGHLRIQGSELLLEATNGDNFFRGIENGSVRIYHDNAQKLVTTSTGIDITGTVTSDALTVQTAQGDISIDNSSSTLNFARAGASYIRATNSLGHFNFITGANNFTNKRLQIASNGDISFYDDTGSTQGLFWDASAERLGIGDTTPDAKLTVQGDVLARDEFRGEVVSYSSNQDAPYLIASTSGYTGATTNWNTYGFQHRFKTDSGGAPRVTIDTFLGEAFAVTNNNRVGIGTGAPSTALHVSAGDGSAELTVARTGTYASSWSLKPYNADFYIRESGSDRVTFKAGGNVGIGTTSPTETLHVMSGVSNDTVAIISGSQSDRGLTISTYASDGRTDGGVDLDAYKSFKFTTDGTERASIDSSGNLAIGNTSAAAKLDIRQDSGSAIRCEDGSGAYFVVKQGGLVGIGTPSPDAPLTVHNSSDPEIRFGYSSTQDHKIAWDSSKVFIHADPENANGSSAIGFAVDGSEKS